MSLASIEKILNIQPIEGADNIECASVLGYQVVVRKREFEIGNYCVWHNPDTIVANHLRYEFLRSKKFRLKVVKLRGQVSQGLALPVNLFPEITDIVLSTIKNPSLNIEGTDITSLIGIKKYEKQIPACLQGKAKGNLPSFVIKTDEVNLRTRPQFIDNLKDKACYITVKMDGASLSLYFKDGAFGICSRNLDLIDDDSIYWKTARKYNIEEKLKNLGRNIVIQGEMAGPGIQSNHAKLSDVQLFVFNIFDINEQKFFNYHDMQNLCKTLELPTVKEIWEENFSLTLEELINLANNTDYFLDLPAEGIVVRPCVEDFYVFKNHKERLSFKVISEKYALKYGE